MIIQEVIPGKKKTPNLHSRLTNSYTKVADQIQQTDELKVSGDGYERTKYDSIMSNLEENQRRLANVSPNKETAADSGRPESGMEISGTGTQYPFPSASIQFAMTTEYWNPKLERCTSAKVHQTLAKVKEETGKAQTLRTTESKNKFGGCGGFEKNGRPKRRYPKRKLIDNGKQSNEAYQMPLILTSRGLIGKNEDIMAPTPPDLNFRSMPQSRTGNHEKTYTVTPLVVMTNEKLQELSHDSSRTQYQTNEAEYEANSALNAFDGKTKQKKSQLSMFRPISSNKTNNTRSAITSGRDSKQA